MPQYLKMTEDAYGSPNGRAVYHYAAGAVYHTGSTPPVDDFLFAAFVASGRAVECDVEGTPLAPTAPAKASKSAAKNTTASDAASALETAIEQVVEQVTESASTPAPEDAPKG